MILNFRLVVGLLLISMWKVDFLLVNRLFGWLMVISLMSWLVGFSVVLFGVLLVMKVFMWFIDWFSFSFFVFLGSLLRVVMLLC